MQLALDAMGGDHAPGPIVLGAVRAVQKDSSLRVVLVGDQAQIEPHLVGADAVRDRLEIFHCTQAIGMEETPVLALRKKPDNSISRCWQLLAEHKVDAIVSADWPKYQEMCDPSLTCFEPEALGQLVTGIDFHQFYFKLGAVQGHHCTTMASPHVRVMGEVAVVSYVRLNQRVGADGSPVTRSVEETRVWQRQNGRWKHVHFHRSAPAK